VTSRGGFWGVEAEGGGDGGEGESERGDGVVVADAEVATGAEREPRGFGAIGWLGRKCSGSKASGLSQYLEWRWGVGANEEGDGGPALGDNALHEVPDLSGGDAPTRPTAPPAGCRNRFRDCDRNRNRNLLRMRTLLKDEMMIFLLTCS
jgi:hypothetical protein